MDRNSIFGLLLIGVLIVGYSIYTQPSVEERKVIQHKADSIAAVKQDMAEQMQKAAQLKLNTPKPVSPDTMVYDSTGINQQKFGSFSAAATGTERLFS